MSGFRKYCVVCKAPFTEAQCCCSARADGKGGHINGVCIECCPCHSRAEAILGEARVEAYKYGETGDTLVTQVLLSRMIATMERVCMALEKKWE